MGDKVSRMCYLRHNDVMSSGTAYSLRPGFLFMLTLKANLSPASRSDLIDGFESGGRSSLIKNSSTLRPRVEHLSQSLTVLIESGFGGFGGDDLTCDKIGFAGGDVGGCLSAILVSAIDIVFDIVGFQEQMLST